MTQKIAQDIQTICRDFGNDRTRLMDIARAVQARFGGFSEETIDLIAGTLDMARVDVESQVSFYSFLSRNRTGEIVIRLCNDIIDRMQGLDRVRQIFEAELGIPVGETTSDGRFSLEETPCIGMCDQAPAALINDVVATHLSSDFAREIVAELKKHGDPHRLVKKLGDGNNAHDLVSAMVENNIRKTGPVILTPASPGEGLQKALAMTPAEVIRNVKTARLRGRGGAGFPTGMKWEFTRSAAGKRKYVICNADEGEPGTFKDRVILTEYPDLMFEGMTIAGYAIGAQEGLVYLRAEYSYLRPYLESILEERRTQGLLGPNICGREGFHFDIRIQMGAGSYVCGEETALISSCEGSRGDPKTRPPFPAQKGFLGCPTSVNNVETFCCVVRILQKGAAWFSQIGSKGSSGTKLLSISGDCRRPGVYEVPFGITLGALLEMVGGEDAQAVQVGGPSGELVSSKELERRICFDDLVTGGAVMVFGPERDILEIVHAFMEFFVEESCGYCTPCRVGNVLLKQCLEKVMKGHGALQDLAYLEELGKTVRGTSRCGLGQTSPNPVLDSLRKFREAYQSKLLPDEDEKRSGFDLARATAVAAAMTPQKSLLADEKRRS